MKTSKTDKAWEDFGRQDPYFGVLADPKYHRNKLDSAALADFFLSGKNHLQTLMAEIQLSLGKEFKPSRGLDFGCGVGRILLPLSEILAEAVGVDISDAMLEEAKLNCQKFNRTNVSFFNTNQLPQITGKFDFIHSYIVFQHIPPAQGESILRQLLGTLSEQGVAVVHLTGAWNTSLIKKAIHAAQGIIPGLHSIVNLMKGRAWNYPFMRMFQYDLASLKKSLSHQGFEVFKFIPVTHGDHTGELLFIRRK